MDAITAGARRDFVIGAAFFGVAALIPFLEPQKYILNQIILFFIWAGVVTQWNLVFGVAGIFSLAQMAVFAIGGYTAAMLSLYFKLSIWATAPIGALNAVLVGAIIGIATLRLRGVYVALLTLAIAVVMQTMILTDSNCFYYEGRTCYNFTGGPRGLSAFGDFGFRDWLGYSRYLWGSYYLGLVLLLLGTIFAFTVIRSSLGVALFALRDNATLSRARGINRTKYQILVFALSAFFTGLMGAFYAGHYKTIGHTVLDLSVLLFLLSMMVVGGLGRFWGPLLGSALMMIVDDLLKDYAEWRMIGLGAITIVFVIVLQRGLVGLIETGWLRFGRYLEARGIASIGWVGLGKR